MEKNKSLQVKKENVFSKILNFIIKLFGRSKQEVISSSDSVSDFNDKQSEVKYTSSNYKN